VASEFFETRNIVLVPNCSIGMKSILETLVKHNKSLTVAYLSPIYGATQKLLQCFKNEGLLQDVLAFAPGNSVFLVYDSCINLKFWAQLYKNF